MNICGVSLSGSVVTLALLKIGNDGFRVIDCETKRVELGDGTKHPRLSHFVMLSPHWSGIIKSM